MTEPVHTIDVETATGRVRLDVTAAQAFTILRQLEHAIEPDRLRLAVLAAADPEHVDLETRPAHDQQGRLRLVGMGDR